MYFTTKKENESVIICVKLTVQGNLATLGDRTNIYFITKRRASKNILKVNEMNERMTEMNQWIICGGVGGVICVNQWIICVFFGMNHPNELSKQN